LIDEGSDALDARWAVFVDKLVESDFWASPESVDLFIDFRLTLSNLLRLVFRNRSSKILVQVEPRSVNPMQYSSLVEGLFDVLITERDQSQYSSARVHWTPGYDFDFREHLSPVRSQPIGSLAGNKYSFVSGSQYRPRVTELNKLKVMGYEANMAGRGWSRNLWHSRGLELLEFVRCIFSGTPRAPSSKWIALTPALTAPPLGEFSKPFDFWKDVDCAFVVENEEGLMSEKIFDAVSAGCRILYAGKALPPSPYIFQLKKPSISVDALHFIDRDVKVDREEIREQSMIALRKVIPSTEEGFSELCRKIIEVRRSNERH
jgi:hypothetical protein